MIAFRWILLLFSLTAVEPFHAVPVPLSSRSIASRSPLPKVPLAAKGGADSARNMESEGPILLPPADYSKPGHVVNLGDDDSGSEVGHVMLNRKMTLSFTCNVCDGRSTYQVNRVSFMQGIVVLWCQGCNQKHLIADNLGKLDFPEFGRNLEEFMAKKGTPVKRVVMSKEGISHLEVAVPSKDYPEVNPHHVSNNHDDDDAEDSGPIRLRQRGFDGSSLLPGVHVGDDAGFPLSDPQPSRQQEFDGDVGALRDSEDPSGQGSVVDDADGADLGA